MDALKIKLRNWVAKVRFSKLIRHFNRNASPFEDNTDFLKATLTLLNISRKGRNFVEIILLATELLSIQNPDTPGGLYHFIDAIALPKPSSLLQLNDRMIGLCQKHPKNEVQAERRAMCALVWSILATKLAGRLSAQLLNNQVVDILFDSIRPHHANLTQIFSLIAIQSFMTTRENKVRLLAAGLPGLLSSIIHESSVNLSAEKRMEADRRRLHLLRSVLDRRINVVRQNYHHKSLLGLNCALDWRLADHNLDFSGDFLEVQNNLSSFATVVGTHCVKRSKWYYEVELLTAGMIQIGWATSASVFSTHSGIGVGDEAHSFSYDGSRMVCWFFQDTFLYGCSKWSPGDIVGCYLDLSNWSSIFYVNGNAVSFPIQLPPDGIERFLILEGGFRPAISLTIYEHVRVNFGNQPFKFPPPEGYYRYLNKYGKLDDEFKIGPISHASISGLILELKMLSVEEEENLCQLCCTNKKCVLLLPCQHDGICEECIIKINTCPFCRREVLSWDNSFPNALAEDFINR